MKIIYASGQTCNQFWIYSNFIAEAYENKENFLIWMPDITVVDYPNLLNSNIIGFPLYFKSLAKVLGHKKYIRFLTLFFGNKYSIYLCEKFLNIIPHVYFVKENVTTKKSKFRLKNLDQIKYIYTPDKNITDEVDDVFREKNNAILVGVHIRRGDYLTYENGKYFYGLEEYKDMMLQMVKLLPNKDVIFFIASNEDVSIPFFSGLNCFSLPNSSSVKDSYALSLTDYIIGPPSTFSAWSSLYGDIPLYFIEDSKVKMSLDKFKKIVDMWF